MGDDLMPSAVRAVFLAIVVCLSLSTVSFAQQSAVHPQNGPATIALNADTTLQLPAGFIFFDKHDTESLMRQLGNPPTPDELGLITRRSAKWFILISYSSPGHIKDDDANRLNADELLKSFQEGTVQSNEERKKMGVSPIELKGWTEKPRYDATKHYLIWALNGSSKEGEFVNYFTRILGREGMLSLNLVTGPNELENSRNDVASVWGAATFNSGQQYADFKAGKDRDSGMTLTSLILGGGAAAAAVKMGLLGKLGHFLIVAFLALKKLAILLIMGIVAGFKKLFGGGGGSAKTRSTAEPPPG